MDIISILSSLILRYTTILQMTGEELYIWIYLMFKYKIVILKIILV